MWYEWDLNLELGETFSYVVRVGFELEHGETSPYVVRVGFEPRAGRDFPICGKSGV